MKNEYATLLRNQVRKKNADLLKQWYEQGRICADDFREIAAELAHTQFQAFLHQIMTELDILPIQHTSGFGTSGTKTIGTSPDIIECHNST